MLKRIEAAAEQSVARGCGFAGLGAGCCMLGLSGEAITLALQAGGILTLLTCAVLILKALTAQKRPYKYTEVWIMLKPAERPHVSVAQHMIGDALRAVYLRYAMHTALLATGFLALSALISLSGISLRR